MIIENIKLNTKFGRLTNNKIIMNLMKNRLKNRDQNNISYTEETKWLGIFDNFGDDNNGELVREGEKSSPYISKDCHVKFEIFDFDFASKKFVEHWHLEDQKNRDVK